MHNEKTNNWGDSSYSGITSVECVCVCVRVRMHVCTLLHFCWFSLCIRSWDTNADLCNQGFSMADGR